MWSVLLRIYIEFMYVIPFRFHGMLRFKCTQHVLFRFSLFFHTHKETIMHFSMLSLLVYVCVCLLVCVCRTFSSYPASPVRDTEL